MSELWGKQIQPCECGQKLTVTLFLDTLASEWQHGDNQEARLMYEHTDLTNPIKEPVVDWLIRLHQYEGASCSGDTCGRFGDLRRCTVTGEEKSG